jgi:hypothetical protein
VDARRRRASSEQPMMTQLASGAVARLSYGLSLLASPRSRHQRAAAEEAEAADPRKED